MFAALPAAQAVNAAGASAPAASLLSTLPPMLLAPSSVTPTGPSFAASGVSSAITIVIVAGEELTVPSEVVSVKTLVSRDSPWFTSVVREVS